MNKQLRHLIVLALLFVAGCAEKGAPASYDIHVSYQSQPIKIVGCQPVVSYSGRSFKTSGIEIPVPQLGGDVKVGEISYEPKTLNTLYRNVAILDALRLQYCGDRVAAANVSLAALQVCNERVQAQEEKIAALALSATEGEAAVEKAIHQFGTASPAVSPPANPDTKQVDNNAVAAVAKSAQSAGVTPAPSSIGATAGSEAGATPSSIANLPPQVASVVAAVPTRTLLKVARTKPPQGVAPKTGGN